MTKNHFVRIMYGTLPLLALGLPGAALAATSATNTATLTLPAGVTDPNTANNTVTDTDNVLAALVANNDTATVNAGTGGTGVVNLLSNDTVNGSPATTTTATVTATSTLPAGVTLNANGTIDVATTTAPGVYTINYNLCEVANPTNCKPGTLTLTVSAVITPVAETGTGVAFTASTPIANVRSNDTVNGAAATSANSTIAVDTANPLPAGFTLNTTTGAVSIDNTVAAGTYDVWYKLCDTSTPTANCATVKDTVTVSNRNADISIAKDNGGTSVTSGQTVTYTLTISSAAGSDSVTGIVVKDTPGAGLTCPTTNPLSFGGTGTSAIPSGSYTISNLTGAGITLGQLDGGKNVTITYSCTVN